MLKKYSESDFYELKSVANNRLSPDAVSAWFISAFIVCSIMSLVVSVGVHDNINITGTGWHSYVKIDVIILIFQFFITLFFLREKNAYKFQKIQFIFLCIFSIKSSITPYAVYFSMCDNDNEPKYMFNLGIYFLLGGFLYLFLSIMRGLKRVKQGELKKGGRSLYNFQNSKGYVSLPIIYILTMLSGSIARTFSGTSHQAIVSYFALLLFVLLQYSIAMAFPEFLLMTYCKFKFPSFIIDAPKRIYEKHESFKNSLLYWYNKPIKALKSRWGWEYDKKAPFWVNILIWLQLTICLEIFCNLLNLRNIITHNINHPPSTQLELIQISMFAAFNILIFIFIILKTLRK